MLCITLNVVIYIYYFGKFHSIKIKTYNKLNKRGANKKPKNECSH